MHCKLTSFLLFLCLSFFLGCNGQQELGNTTRSVNISVVHDNDLILADWLSASVEPFEQKINSTEKDIKLSLTLKKESTLQALENIASGKEKSEAILLPDVSYLRTTKDKIKNLGAAVSSCKEIMGSPFIAIIPKKQTANLPQLLGRNPGDLAESSISITLKELGTLLRKSNFGYTNPARSTRGQLAMLLSIAALSSSNLEGVDWNIPINAIKDFQSKLDWYAPSDASLIKRISSLASESGGIGNELTIGIVSKRQLQANSELNSNYAILNVADKTVWETQTLCISEADWVSPSIRALLAKYQQFLSSQQMLDLAKQSGFIPLSSLEDREPKPILQHRISYSESKAELSNGYIEERKKPYSIAYAIDTSASMLPENLNELGEFGKKLVLAKSQQSHVDILKFSFELESLTNGSVEETQKKLSSLTASGGSALYDAISKTYQLLSQYPSADSRRVAVIITDGNDINSSKNTTELITQIKNQESTNGYVSLHLILLESPDVDIAPLQKIVNAASGTLYQSDSQGLHQLLDDISQAL